MFADLPEILNYVLWFLIVSCIYCGALLAWLAWVHRERRGKQK